MITEDYVSFETAKLLKEKGFNELCCQKYDGDGDLSSNHVGYINDEKPCDDFCALAPTLQMTMKWLRKAHNIYIYATPWYHEEENPLKKGEYNPIFDGWGYNILNLTTNAVIAESDEDNLYSTPEEACEMAIKYYLEKLW